MQTYLTKDKWDNWNTNPPIPAEIINNVNCHKFVLYAIGRISWEEMISGPTIQKINSIDFTYGDMIKIISETPYTLIKDEESLNLFANENCNIGKQYIGQVLDAETEEMAHSFIVNRESDTKYVCFDKPGFKYPFSVSDLNAIINFVNKDGEQSNKNQNWRFVSIESINLQSR